MATSKAAVRRLESALASTRKRASDLRKKIKTEQPTVIASTVGGAYLVPYVERSNPFKDMAWGRQPELLIGAALVGYGLFSARSGQTEKILTAAGTGMLSVAAYKFSQSQGQG
jgi:hypothetical protein